MAFLLRRLGFYALSAFVAVTVNFFLPRLMPGDPAVALFSRFQGRLAPEAMVALRESFGLSGGSLVSQYGRYLAHLAQGDLGVSVAYFPAPVGSLLAHALPWTVLLAGSSLAVSFTLGTALGVLVAWRRDSVLDRFLPGFLTFIGAFPYFFVALAAVYLFGYQLRVLPVGNAYGADVAPSWSFAFARDVAAHGLLPLATLVVTSCGGWVLTMRSSLVGVLGSEHVRMALARGIPRWRVMLFYAARTAILPSVTSLGMAIGFVVGGSLLTEVVFSYPGQGYLLVQAVRAQDYALMQGIFLLITLSVLAGNFLVDALTVWLDPRTREADS